ncbi:MAG: PEP-CTERM sorting domain-containing protein [Planctomycetia bacterium]|nr:PEP-CTERM sorting domain-containing protein [Planctomycetia bacterium]
MENETAMKQVDMSMYRLIFSKENLPKMGSTSVGQSTWYDYGNPNAVGSGYSGAMYYYQMTNNSGGTEWVLIDAPNYSGTNAYTLGISRAGQGSDVVNKVVTGADVYTSYSSAKMPLFTNVTADGDGVKSLTDTNLILEFWPYNYSGNPQGTKPDQNGNNFTLASPGNSNFDWNDSPYGDGDHGSWQIHAYDSTAKTGQTLIGLSRLYRDWQTVDMTLGNSGNGASDGTNEELEAKFFAQDGRSLQIFAVPNYSANSLIFNATKSDWGTADSWLTSTGATATATPTTGNEVYVNAGTAVLSGAGTTGTLNVDMLGTVNMLTGASLKAGNVNLEGTVNSAANWTAGMLSVARYGSTGKANFTGGTLNLSEVAIAYDNGSKGEMTMDNTTISGARFNVGYRGNGLFTMNSGTITVTDYYCIGNNVAHAYGEVHQYGGTVNARWMPLGHNGKGEYNLYGGEINITGTGGGLDAPGSVGNGLQIGDRKGSNTVFNMSGGTINSATDIHIGRVGTGVMNQTGGDVVTTRNIIVGHIIDGDYVGTGTWNMDGGTITVGDSMAIAYKGNGTFVQNKGTLAVTNTFYVANETGSTATWTMSGDETATTTSAKNIYIGNKGNGTLTQNGGKVTATVSMYVGNDGVSTASWTMNGGTTTVSDWLHIANKGNGTLVQNGGTITVNNRFSVASSTGSVGEWTMNGGTVNAKTLAIGDNGSGTFNMYDGSIRTTEWFLAGFNNGVGVVNQYGGDIDAGWVTTGWEIANANGTYNMYGGTLNTRGDGNPMVIARTGQGVFNLYDGEVTLAAAKSSNQENNSSQFIGYALKIGAYDGSKGEVNIYAGDMTATGNVSIGKTSSLNFRPGMKGIGTLNVTGNMEVADGGKVTVAPADGIMFIDDYSLENGKDIMSVSGKNAVTVTNMKPELMTGTYSTDTGKLTLKMNDDAYYGVWNAENGFVMVDSATTGWVSLENLTLEDLSQMTLAVDTNGMAVEDFVEVLNTSMMVGEDSYGTAEAVSGNQVLITMAPDFAKSMESNVYAWNFSDSSLFGPNGVAVTALYQGDVPEPATWVLLALGVGLMVGFRRKK